MKLRFIDSGAAGPLPGALNMGIDEAVLAAVSRGESPPTLRLYRWSPPCVTVGYFQGLEAEVDLEACRAGGVDTVRRLTGGHINLEIAGHCRARHWQCGSALHRQFEELRFEPSPPQCH